MPLSPEQKIDVATRIQNGELSDKIAIATYIQSLSAAPEAAPEVAPEAAPEAAPLPNEGPGSFQIPKTVQEAYHSPLPARNSADIRAGRAAVAPYDPNNDPALQGGNPLLIGQGKAFSDTEAVLTGEGTFRRDPQAEAQRDVYRKGVGQTGLATAGEILGSMQATAPLGGGTTAALSKLPFLAGTEAIPTVVKQTIAGGVEGAAMSPEDTGTGAILGAGASGVLASAIPGVNLARRGYEALKTNPFTNTGQKFEAGKILKENAQAPENLAKGLAKENPELAVKLSAEDVKNSAKLADMSSKQLEERLAAKELPNYLPTPPPATATRITNSKEAFKVKERYKNAAKEIEKAAWKQVPDTIRAPITPLMEDIYSYITKLESRSITNAKLVPKEELEDLRRLEAKDQDNIEMLNFNAARKKPLPLHPDIQAGVPLSQYQGIRSSLLNKQRNALKGDNANPAAAKIYGELADKITKHMDTQGINDPAYQKARAITAEYKEKYGYKPGGLSSLLSKRTLPSKFLDKATASPEGVEKYLRMVTKEGVADPNGIKQLKAYTVKKALASPSWGDGIIQKVPGAAKEIKHNRELIAKLEVIDKKKLVVPHPFSKEGAILDTVMYGAALTGSIGFVPILGGAPTYWIAKKSGLDFLKTPKEKVITLLTEAVQDPEIAKGLRDGATEAEVRNSVRAYKNYLATTPGVRTTVVVTANKTKGD